MSKQQKVALGVESMLYFHALVLNESPTNHEVYLVGLILLWSDIHNSAYIGGLAAYWKVDMFDEVHCVGANNVCAVTILGQAATFFCTAVEPYIDIWAVDVYGKSE